MLSSSTLSSLSIPHHGLASFFVFLLSHLLCFLLPPYHLSLSLIMVSLLSLCSFSLTCCAFFFHLIISLYSSSWSRFFLCVPSLSHLLCFLSLSLSLQCHVFVILCSYGKQFLYVGLVCHLCVSFVFCNYNIILY